jgi:cytidyltransferase-like protein
MKTAYTYGVYDLFHVGHLNLFKRIKETCDKLIVGVHNDEQVKTYKKAPIIIYKDRLELIRSCRYVDEVYENADLVTTDELLNKINADYVFAGKENEHYIKKYYQVNDNRLILLDRTSHICTSDIIEKIIKNRQT